MSRASRRRSKRTTSKHAALKVHRQFQSVIRSIRKRLGWTDNRLTRASINKRRRHAKRHGRK